MLLVSTIAPPLAAQPSAKWELVSRPGMVLPYWAAYDTLRGRVVVVSGESPDGSLFDWDGQQWTQWFPELPRPWPPGGPIAFDTTRGRLMAPAVGGRELWELDPVTRRWQKQEPVAGMLPDRVASVAVYDPDRRRLYVAGGGYQGRDLFDLWEWDAVTRTWTERGTIPKFFGFASWVYDPDRRRLVVTSDGGMVHEWNPATAIWTMAQSGGPRQCLRAQYDPVQHALFCFGDRWDVWQWDPSTSKYSERVPARLDWPIQQEWRAATFDPSRQRFVFTGGVVRAPGVTTLGRLDEVWEWSSVTNQWTQGTPAHFSPGAVVDASAVYLPETRRVLMVGRSYTTTAILWDPDRRTWSPLFASSRGLVARSWSSLALDQTRQVVMLFGGAPMYADLWELRLGDFDWTARPSDGPAPAARRGAGLVHLPNRGTLVLQGGLEPIGNARQDGWEWNASTGVWQLRADSSSAPHAAGALFHDASRDVLVFVTRELLVWEAPAAAAGPWKKVGDGPDTPAEGPAVAFDPLRRKILIYGGTDRASLQATSDLWEWDIDARRWSALAVTGPGPLPRYGHTMVYDSWRQTFFVYGGSAVELMANRNQPDAFRDGWELTVGNLPGGERCQEAHAERCATGLCVDGKCCATNPGCGVEPPRADAAPADGGVVMPADAASPADVASAPDGAAPELPADRSPTGTTQPFYASPGCACSTAARPGAVSAVSLLWLLMAAGRRWRRERRRVRDTRNSWQSPLRRDLG